MNGDRGSIFMIETYVTKPERLVEFVAYKNNRKDFSAEWLKDLGRVVYFLGINSVSSYVATQVTLSPPP
jgi:hypothetical protein